MAFFAKQFAVTGRELSHAESEVSINTAVVTPLTSVYLYTLYT